MGNVDWVWWASTMWPLAVAVPGFIAFAWQWNDRRTAVLSRAPHVEMATRYNFGLKDVDGWVPISFFIRNDANVPLKITKIEVLGPKGVLLSIAGQNLPNFSYMGRLLVGKWRVEAVLHRTDGGIQWSTVINGFLGSTARSISDAQVSIRFTFSEMAATQRQSSIKITTDPIKLPHANMKTTV